MAKVVLILTPELHNIIGEEIEIDEDRGTILLGRPRLIVSGQRPGTIMFPPLSPFLATAKEGEMPFRMIACEVPAKQIEEGYRQSCSNIILSGNSPAF